MPTVHYVQKARKGIPDADINPGDSYYWWKFRNTGKLVSKTPPAASQLTQSEFWGTYYSIVGENSAVPPFDDLSKKIGAIIADLDSLADETDCRRDNIPDSLQDGPVGQMMEERSDTLRGIIDDLESIDLELPPNNEGVPDSEHKMKSATRIWEDVHFTLDDVWCQ